MTFEALRDLLRSFQEVWDRDLSAAAIKLYFAALAHIPDRAAPALLARVLRSSRFWPLPSDVCQAYAEMLVGEDDAEEQWSRVMAIGRGATAAEADLSPRGHAALRQTFGPWWELEFAWQRAEPATVAAWHKRFIEVFRKAHRAEFEGVRLGRERNQAPPLPVGLATALAEVSSGPSVPGPGPRAAGEEGRA